MYLNKKTNLRLREYDLEMIEQIVSRDRLKYENESHFIRCAILKLLREEAKRLKIPYKTY